MVVFNDSREKLYAFLIEFNELEMRIEIKLCYVLLCFVFRVRMLIIINVIILIIRIVICR